MESLDGIWVITEWPVTRELECVSCTYSDTCFMYVYLNVFHVCIIECVSCMYN